MFLRLNVQKSFFASLQKDRKFWKTKFVVFGTFMDIFFLSFLFLFYCFLSILEWFRYNFQKTFLINNVVLYLLIPLDLYKFHNSRS